MLFNVSLLQKQINSKTENSWTSRKVEKIGVTWQFQEPLSKNYERKMNKIISALVKHHPVYGWLTENYKWSKENLTEIEENSKTR